MEYENGNLGTDNVKSLLHKLAVPAIISLMVAKMYNMVDTIFVGRAIGSEAIGALTISLPMQTLIIAIAVMIAAGSSSVSARCFGAKNHERAQKVAANGILICILLSLTIVFFSYIFLDEILMALGSNSELLTYAKDYMSIVLFGGILNTFTIVIPELIIASGNAKISMKATIIGAITNIVLDFLLVIVIPFGVKGAAYATIIGQLFSAFYVLRHFIGGKSVYKLSLSHFKLEFGIIKEILSVGLSAFIIDASDAIMVIVLNKIVGNLMGTMGITIVGIITKVYLFMDITVIGITTGMQPIASYNYGALRYNRVVNVVKYSIKSILVLSTVLWMCQLVFATNIVELFVNNSAALSLEASKTLRIALSLFPVSGLYFVATYFYQSIGKSKVAFIFSILKQILIFAPLACLLGYGTKLGVYGVWLAFPITDILVSLISLMFLKKSIRKLGTKKSSEIQKKVFQYMHS